MLFDHGMAHFWGSAFTFWPTRRFSTLFWWACRAAHQRKNRLEALLHALRGQALLRFLPGERYIFNDGTCQEENPGGNGSQFSPQIAGFFALEARPCPAQGLFA